MDSSGLLLIVFYFLSSFFHSQADDGDYSNKSVNPTQEGSSQHSKKEPPIGSKIRNGVKAGKDEFPYIVAVSHSNNPNEIYSAGVIIDSKWILTAEHVMRQGRTRGQHYITPNYDNKASGTGRRKRYAVVGYFCPKGREGDIGLMELRQEIPFNQDPFKFQKIQMIDSNRKLDPKRKITVAGWGFMNISFPLGPQYPEGASPSDLMKTDVQLRPDSDCSSHPYFNAPKLFCTTGQIQGTCNGDSGGPLVIKNGGNSGDILVGLVSGGGQYCK